MGTGCPGAAQPLGLFYEGPMLLTAGVRTPSAGPFLREETPVPGLSTNSLRSARWQP